MNAPYYAPATRLVSLSLPLAILLALFISGFAQERPPEPKREFRGTWVASVFNLDWPSSSRASPASQQAQLIAILENARRLHLNAVVLQVRPNADALYQSSLEPWSAWLTGRMGTDPGYDPLAFAVTEAHRRGLQLHAWINPFRALATTEGGISERHISQRHPEWIRKYGTQLLLDPGIPEARDYVQRVVLDIVRRYDIDGVHLDDYFYPYPLKGATFPDTATYKRYGGSRSRSEWRRENIDRFVSGLYAAIKAEKRYVLFGISPFGIWRPGVPATTSAGVDAYETLGCDARLWLQRGWVDYLSPQLYWASEPAAQSFPVLYNWWSEQNALGRHLWPGLGTERIGSGRTAAEQTRQINTIRRGRNDAGHIHWSNSSLMQNRGGITTLLARATYSDLALVPPSPWLDRDPPARPALSSAPKNGAPTLIWGASDPKIASYLVQFRTAAGWDTRVIGALNSGVEWPGGTDAVSGVVVRAISRTGILSEPATLQR